MLSFVVLLATAAQPQCSWTPVSLSPQPLAGKCTPLVDDHTPATPSASKGIPWTQPLYCATIEVAEKFCVYSSSTFNDGSGISLIAKPETAAGVVGVIQDPMPAWRSRRHIAPSGCPRIKLDDLSYTVIPVPGKGLGVVATRRITQLETIMTSFPAIIADNELFPSDEDERPARADRLFQRALDQLPDQERFLSLARSKGEGVHPVDDVIRTNAFGITVDGRDMKGLYPEIAEQNWGSRLTPSSAYSRFTTKDLAMSVLATRDIEPGEEITISYVPLGITTTQRTRKLSNWGFNCSCELCSAPPEAREASDQRRERMVEVYYAMQDESTSYNTLVELTREFIKLAQVERLLAKVGEYYQALMRIYYGFGDAETARKYGQASLKFAEIFSDPDGGFCAGIRRDLRQLNEELSERRN
ncbi:SET domain-protein 5 [Staphylotrichum tortipilum]|uniref:SET domain-protein 5 n=1 Tax=Staphylotrichum tortipilum TaxID=2831512 RepID=A0AAN6MSB7_9PEZI|nr:SET domain-protein 5 [Staphylotrichum longicolle]